MIREALKNKIAEIPDVATICEGRVFWLRNESAIDTPCIIFRIVGGEAFQDDSCDQPGPIVAEVDWYAISEDPEQAVQLQEAVRSAMNGPWTTDTVSVHRCRFSALLEDDYLEDGEHSSFVCGGRLEIQYEHTT